MAKITENFCVFPSEAKEVTTAALPVDAAKELACHKALDVFKHLPGEQQNSVVVGCDTVVDVDGIVFGKPADQAEAKRMLRLLSGRSHQVHTGYCVVTLDAFFLGAETTTVTFRRLTDEEITAYVHVGSPLDKAGAYGIQETDFVASISGSYDNVVGFPAEVLTKIFERLNQSTDTKEV